MNKKEFRKLLGDNFEEISRDEYCNMNNKGEFSVCLRYGELYFKPKEQYPKVFEDDYRKVKVEEDGNITIYNKIREKEMYFSNSLPILYKAVELSKKQRN